MNVILTENVKCEAARLEEQAKNLQPVAVPDTDITVECTGYPTLVDGKVKTYWSNTDNFQKCYLCHCGEKDLRQRSNPNFNIKNFEALKFGFSPLHCLLRSFDWFIKAKTYSGVRSYAA